MATVDYAEIAATATEMLTEYGVTATLTKPPRPDYNPATSDVEGGLSNDFEGPAVRDDYNVREIDGSRILRGDARIYLSVDGIPQPAPGDLLAFAGETFRVVDCTPIKPADVAVLYELQVRK